MGLNLTIECINCKERPDLPTVFPPSISPKSVKEVDSNLCPPDQELGILTKELASRLLV
jgi:hypothetical protein